MAVNNFPGLEVQPSGVSDAPPPLIAPENPGALASIAQSTAEFGAQVQDMAVKATQAAASLKATADATAAGPTGALAMQNPVTVWGQTYNTIAQQTMGVQRQAALHQAMGDAYADKQNDPGALDQAFTAIKTGFAPTGFPELDASLNGDWAVQRANYMVQAADALHQRTIAQGQGNFAQTLESGTNLLSQTAASASFDTSGSQRVALAYANLVQQLSKYGPKEAYDVGDFHFAADPTRLGALNADDIEKTALAAHRQATMSWIMGQSDRLPDAGAKTAFAADVESKFDSADPLVAGLGDAERFSLERHLDAAATRAGTAEDTQRRLAENNARGMIEQLRLGGDVDLDQLAAQAAASGDATTIADAGFYSSVARNTPGVLKHAAAAALGLTGGPGGVPLDANGHPVPAPGQNAVADEIRSSAAASGASPAEAANLVRFAQTESNLNPNSPASSAGAQGLFQFSGKTWQDMGGGDIGSVQDQTRNALKLMREHEASLQAGLGRPATTGELYLAHQQNGPGALALLTAGPTETAVQALTPVYGGNVVQATRAVVGNGGSATMGAAAFARQWTGRFDSSAAGGALAAAPPAPAAGPTTQAAFQPPAGVQPGTPVSVAFANTAEKFSSDPLDYVRGAAGRPAIADVAPMDVSAPFKPGTDQLPAWGQALAQRYAVGQSVARSYMVPPRILTNGERDAVKAAIAQDPANAVALARDAQAAIGSAGATALLKEVGDDGAPEVSTSLQLAGLELAGQTSIVDRSIQGLQLRSQGAKPVEFDPSYGPHPLDAAMQGVGPALRFAPQVAIAARNIADLAHTADAARGSPYAPADYIQAALGGGQQNGRWYGGVTTVNGQKALVPSWLAQDSVPDALRALGGSWAQHPGMGPAYANGQPMNANDVGKLVPMVNPAGTYWLANPQTGRRAMNARGVPIEVDFDQNRAFLQRVLPHAVLAQ